jgi:hypothetical protein
MSNILHIQVLHREINRIKAQIHLLEQLKSHVNEISLLPIFQLLKKKRNMLHLTAQFVLVLVWSILSTQLYCYPHTVFPLVGTTPLETIPIARPKSLICVDHSECSNCDLIQNNDTASTHAMAKSHDIRLTHCTITKHNGPSHMTFD